MKSCKVKNDEAKAHKQTFNFNLMLQISLQDNDQLALEVSHLMGRINQPHKEFEPTNFHPKKEKERKTIHTCIIIDAII